MASKKARKTDDLVLVTFKANPSVIEALDTIISSLADRASPGEIPRGVRSNAIRFAILKTAENIHAAKKE